MVLQDYFLDVDHPHFPLKVHPTLISILVTSLHHVCRNPYSSSRWKKYSTEVSHSIFTSSPHMTFYMLIRHMVMEGTVIQN